MTELMTEFVRVYVQTLLDDDDKAEKVTAFVRRLWGPDIVCKLRRKTTVLLFTCVARTLKNNSDNTSVSIQEDMLEMVAASLQLVFSLGSVVHAYKESLLENLATMLAHTKSIKTPAPLSVLAILALYPLPEKTSFDDGNSDWDSIDKNPSLLALRDWLCQGVSDNPQWASTVGATIATAFVDGMLLSSSKKDDEWDPATGASMLEKTTAKAIALFCTLATSAQQTVSASELLWPGIHKGMKQAPAAIVSWSFADRVARALLLLENGCRLRILTGMGNGDLIVDSKTSRMMPPPPHIEAVLANAFSFSHHHIKALLSADRVESSSSGVGTRSGNARRLSSTFAGLVTQLQTIYEGFPSSSALSTGVSFILKENLSLIDADDGEEVVKPLCLVYAALVSGGETEASKTLSTGTCLLKLKYAESRTLSKSDEQALRSVFEYARWGALSCLLRALLARDTSDTGMHSFLQELFDKTAGAVEATPMNALVPLFDCVVIAARLQFLGEARSIESANVDGVQCLEKIISTLFDLVEECKTGKDGLYMVDGMSSLIFQHSLLLDEQQRLQKDPDVLDPIRSAFRRLLSMAGTQRPYLSRAILTKAVVGWLGTHGNSSPNSGTAAIPYTDDIVRLLLQKDDLVDEAGSNQGTSSQGQAEKDGIELPASLHDQSVSRGIILVFLSELPQADTLQADIFVKLVHPLIVRLLDAVRSSGRSQLVMLGTPEYCLKMRGWQALCVLSRYVTNPIADFVHERAFEALNDPLHSQIRYFVEIFTIQCSRRCPALCADLLVKQITRLDLSLQMISSLMIIAGNLIVGRFQGDFLPCLRGKESEGSKLGLILSGVIPWLSSTQGFSRAIAQLLVHKLIPLTINLDAAETENGTSDWYLRSLYAYLDENSEMKRLRGKQAKFFERYEVDEVCTAEGVLSVPVDEGGEAHPVHMVEAIKECLKEVYEEAHINESPAWKQVEDMLSAREGNDVAVPINDAAAVNFQRKIIPLDALNLALEEVKERRQRNAARRKKQDLIVCASLIDKVPNLGGLARTSEIFAVDRLVVPDKRVVKMDNFTSLSVGAGDWIEIEECKEQVSRKPLLIATPFSDLYLMIIVMKYQDLFRSIVVEDPQ
jgi:hypothetical protein